MYNYVIAIPSYRRAKCLRDKTLRLLSESGIGHDKIHIFVSDDQDYLEYKTTLTPGTYGYIHKVNTHGLGETRNAIQLSFPEGTYILNIDDDIQEISGFIDAKTLVPVGRGLDNIIRTAFMTCEREGTKLWGVYPVNNAFFMDRGYTTDIRYIIGALYGTINTHDKNTFVTLDDKEDFERTIKYYIKHGKVIRYNCVCIKTAYYTEPGGMQVERTEKRISASAKYLLKTYPDYCKDNSKGKKHAEIKLGDFRGK